jgi:heme/copper-type cytochrome/quinol oxidase subunit 2
MKLKSFIAVLLLVGPLTVMAEPEHEYELTISNHVFTPSEIVVPANTKVKIIVHNKDDSFEEFHSDSLKREKIVAGKKSGVVNIGPLAPGEYPFMGEFHSKTAQGRVIAK